MKKSIHVKRLAGWTSIDSGWSEELEGNSERLAFGCGWYMTKAQPYSIKQFSVASFTTFRETSY